MESLEILHFSWGIKSIEFHGQSPQPWETTEKNIRVEKKGKTTQESRVSRTELHECDFSLLS